MGNHMKMLLPFLGLAATSITHISAKEKKQENKLNILYIMTDDHALQTIGCYGSPYAETPNIDRLAKEGVRFTNSFVANSISGPSRACLLTGKHSHTNGKIDNNHHFDGSQQTIQQLMQTAGYETAMIGKWHLESTPTCFDFWEILPGQGDYYNPSFITPKGVVRNEGYVTDIITEKCIDWIENKRDEEKPFLLFMHHKAPHRNWMADTSMLTRYEDRKFDLPATFWDDYNGRIAAAEQEMSIEKDMDLQYDLKIYDPSIPTALKNFYVYKDTLGTYGRMNPEQKAAWDKHYNPIIADFIRQNPKGKELAEWKFQRYLKDYLKTAQSVDESIGQMLKYLEEKGLLENTLIVYTSDQGFYMGEHGWFDKRFMYEESFKTPLIARLPEKAFKKRGFVSDQLVQNIDHGATFLDIAGADVPADIQGESYLSLLERLKPKNWRKSLYYHYHEFPAEHKVKRHFGVRTDRYKLIRFYNNIDVYELYDLKKDPNEMNNLYGKKEYEEIVVKLKKELGRLQELYDDPVRHKVAL
ncbi:MAG: sulfatase family protein [Bacteroidales bacterium]